MGPAAERPIISGKPPTQRRSPSSVAQHAREGAKQKPRQGDGAKGAPCIGACRVATPGKPIETLSQSVAQRRGDSQRSIKSRRTLPRGNTTPETNRDPHRAPIPLAKGSCFGPAHEKAPPGLAGLRSSKRGLAEMRVNGKPAETMAQSVAQCTATEKAPPQGAGLRWVNRFSTTGLPPGGASVTGKMTRALALAGPLTKRRAKPLVSVSGGRPRAQKSPATGSGASLRVSQMGPAAGSRGPNASAASLPTQRRATWLVAHCAHEKAPPGLAGLSLDHEGCCRNARKGNPLQFNGSLVAAFIRSQRPPPRAPGQRRLRRNGSEKHQITNQSG